MNKKYWLTISPNVFIWKKGRKCYLYDSKNHNGKLFYLSDPETELLIDRLMEPDNLYCIPVDKEKISGETENIINELLSANMARLFEADDNKRRPIQLPPLLNLQPEVNRLENGVLSNLTVGENILENIYEIHLIFPPAINKDWIRDVEKQLDALSYSPIRNILISTSSLQEYDLIWNQLAQLNAFKIFILPLKSITKDFIKGIIQKELPNTEFKITIPPGFYENEFNQKKKTLEPFLINTEWEFQITSEKDYEAIERVTEDIQPESIIIKPCFNGKNSSFFENYIYMNEKDIQNIQLTKKNIFAHQALNTHDFGKLTITSDGQVYANPLHAPLGTIKEDIRELIYKEMIGSISWRRIRDQEPCCNCIYQWMCPSPSDYEILLNKNNLCHIYL